MKQKLEVVPCWREADIWGLGRKNNQLEARAGDWESLGRAKDSKGLHRLNLVATGIMESLSKRGQGQRVHTAGSDQPSAC